MPVRTAKLLFESNSTNARFTVVVRVYELTATSVFNNCEHNALFCSVIITQ